MTRAAAALRAGLAGAWRRRPLWSTPAAVVVMLAVAISVLAIQARQLASQIETLALARSDNLTWLVSQVEVNLLALRLAQAQRGPDAAQGPEGADITPAEAATRAFDIFFSRVEMLTPEVLNLDPDRNRALVERLEALRVTVDLMALAVDQGAADAVLHDDFVTATEELQSEVRAISLDALALFVERTALWRDRQSELLQRFSALAILLVVVLSALLLLTVDLYRGIRRRAEAIRRVGATLEKTIEASRDAIIVTDASGIIRGFNAAAETLFGHSRAEATGQVIGALLLSESERPVLAQFRALLRDAADDARRPSVGARAVARHRDGREFPVEAIAIAERDNEGVPVVFAFVRDISERLSVEAALRRARDTAERNAEARSRFVAVVSHEMRTPLHGLTAALDLMARGRLSREQRRFLSIAQGCTQTALNQVEDLLDLTRREGDAGGEPEVVFDPATVCVALVEQSRPLARARGNRISLVVPEAPLGDVLGLRRAFERALGNLLSNAIKFTEGGEIAVRLSRLPGMRDMPEGAVRLRVEVEDQGIGIAAEHQSRIFDDFETLDDGLTRRAGGSGLGLGIARRAVRAMGGEIKLSSAPGRGSLFRFTIPMLPVPHGIAADPRQGDRASAPLCVLLVEDNPVNRTLMVESLQRLGHSAEIALDGRQGVAMAELRAFDLIVMDIGMPEIDGLTASRMIRDGAGLSRRAPILAITAHALPQHSAELRAAGITRLLTKPVRLDAFGAAIADLVLPPDDPLLDRAVLADTRSILGGPAHDRLMAQFASEVAAILGDLAQRRPEPADVAAAAHRLAGSAAVMGALRLRRLLIAVETAAQGGPGPLTERIDLAAATLALTMAAMQAEAAALSDSAEQATPAAGVPAA